MGEYVRFVSFGCLNTLFCFLIYYSGIMLGLNYALANSIAWIAGVLVAFFLNSTFVFRKRYEHRRLLSFVGWNVLSLIVSTAVLSVLIKIFNVDPIMASVVAIPVVVAANYLTAKFIIFK